MTNKYYVDHAEMQNLVARHKTAIVEGPLPDCADERYHVRFPKLARRERETVAEFDGNDEFCGTIEM